MSFLRYLGTNFLWILAILADLVSVSIFFYYSRNPSAEKETGVWIIYLSNLLLVTLTITLLIRVAYLQVRWGRKKRYALAFDIINHGFSELHELERSKLSEVTVYLNYLEKFCDALARTYSHVTTAKCSICIKILTEHQERIEVRTIARDTASRNSRPMQQKDNKKNLHHWVDANTDFHTITTNMDSVDKRFFFCNNLVWLNDYRNTRIPDGEKRSNNFVINQFFKVVSWPLPYKSSLVVPIIPGYFNSTGNEKLGGFLCIDSPQSGVFRKKYDLPIAQGVADGLYNVLSKYYDVLRDHVL